MADDNLLDDDAQERRDTQRGRSLKAMGVDAQTLADAFAEATKRMQHVAIAQEPLGEFVRATVCAKDDGGSYRKIKFNRDELQDPTYAGREFDFGAKVRLKKEAFMRRRNREEVILA